jgi:ABC-type branched-subunit amino acid transport system ATPase component
VLLEARHISVTFGGVRAVVEVDLTCEEGEVVGIVGPNGSGKTTLLNALTGVVPAQGQLVVKGRPVSLGRPDRSYRSGLVRAFQTPQMFPACSVLENVALSIPDKVGTGLTGAWPGRWYMWGHERRRWRRAKEALEYVGLESSALLPATSLPYGQQRLVELARAIAAGPRIFMLDEPSAGLNDTESQNLATLIPSLVESGSGALIVDHKVDFIDRICDRVIVLELGNLVASGTPAEVWSHPRVMDAYLGTSGSA